MRKIYLLLCALIAVNYVNAQTISAGQTIEGGYYYDLDPDIFVYGEYNGPSGSYYLDLNHDGIIDFEIKATSDGGNGGSYDRVLIIPRNDNEVARGDNDICTGPPPNFEHIATRKMANAFEYDEPINSHSSWINSSIFISYSHYVMYSVECWFSTFYRDDLYLGVKVFCSSDTIYGWVKMKSSGYGALKIESFACNNNSYSSIGNNKTSEFKIYPNPAKTNVIIETSNISSESMVSIININGQVFKTAKTN
jgi:hypothetical protein